MSAPRLTAEQKNEMVRRYAAGELLTAIAADFGVHPGYPSLLAKRRGLPRRVPAATCAKQRRSHLLRHGSAA